MEQVNCYELDPEQVALWPDEYACSLRNMHVVWWTGMWSNEHACILKPLTKKNTDRHPNIFLLYEMTLKRANIGHRLCKNAQK